MSANTNYYSSEQDVISKTSFKELAFEAKHGSEVSKCGAFTDDFYEGAINAKDVIDNIKSNRTKGILFFYFFDYVESLSKESITTSFNSTGPPTIITLNRPIPYNYVGFNGKNKIASLDIKLNKRACYINTKKPGVLWNVKPESNVFEVEINFVYDDAIDLRDFNTTPETDNDYKLEEKYNGIVIKVTNTEDLLALSKDLGIEQYIYNRVKTDFKNFLSSIESIEELEFIYKQLPDQLINDIEFINGIGYDTFYKHFKAFFDYDTDGLLSSFRDNSNGVVKSLRCLASFKEKLLKELKEKPEFIKTAYKNLDGSSEYLGEIEQNRTIYADILWSLCQLNNFKGLNRTGKIFRFGNKDGIDYELDSNVWTNNIEDQLFLKQEKSRLTTVKVPKFETDPSDGVTFDTGLTEDKTYRTNLTTDEGSYFHPLDLVIFEIYRGEEEPIRLLVPAIFLKALSDKEEWEEIDKNIRIGVDILAVLLGVLTLGSTSGIWAVLAVADIAIAGTDVVVMTFRDEIASTEGGRAFLQTWEKIYIVGGAITAGPVLIRTFISGGAKLLSQAGKLKLSQDALKYIRTLMLKVVLEVNIHNFTGNTAKILSTNQELITATKGIIDEFKATKLLEANCIIAEGTVQIGKTTQKEVAVIYKGTIIAEGTIGNKAFADLLRKLKGATPNKKKLLELLEGLYENRGIPFLKGFSLKKIVSIPKGKRPKPSLYLPKTYIKNHLELFLNEGVASRIVLKKDYLKYGIGKPDLGKTEFLSLKSQIDKLLKQANGDVSNLSKTLGVPEEQLKGGLVRIDFKLSKKSKLVFPEGNEFGANPQWLPGGKLPTGELEIVIKTEGLILNKDYRVYDIIFNK
ncbi:hypothetical protein [Winogradskyella sp. SYSU M77433]|uniref:hypothetical protein n=1 Tax=Winogradskyella sp. SYSU M77433 TaxID=3042722 RepID=UPI002480DD11|nr:hypothetical protein [Winogradskyella sp. SYSU M77433]MDH7913761.1 hypothetical protein [Winogradskyella sp. SYSU M77433]